MNELETRDYNQLNQSFELAKDIISKNYLSWLNNYELVNLSKEVSEVNITENIRLFKITKLVTDKNESFIEKLVTVLGAAHASKTSLFTIIRGGLNKTDFYFGLVSKDEKIDISTSSETVRVALKGNFTGVREENIMVSEIEDVIELCTTGEVISAVSGVASLRNDDEKEIEKYVQGIEHLVDSLSDREYTLLVLADPVYDEELYYTRLGLESLSTQLSPFVNSTLSFNENDTHTINQSHTEGLSDTIGESLALTQNYTSTSGWSVSDTEGKSVSKKGDAAITATASAIGTKIGMVVGAAEGGVGAVPGAMLGGAIGAAAGGIVGMLVGSTTTNTSHTESHNQSESKSSGQTTTKNTSRTTQSNDTYGDSDATSVGRTLQFVSENKTVKQVIEKIDKNLERLAKCETFGAFNYAAYIISPDIETNTAVACGYDALMRGENSYLESSHINTWVSTDSKQKKQFDEIQKYIRKLSHPVFIRDCKDNIFVSPATLVNPYELAIGLGFPKKSISGLAVVESASFGRSVFCECKGNRQVRLGNVYHMGTQAELGVDIDVDSLTMHTFVTGSTGSGKSNTIYTLIEKVMSQTDAHFMVIEPAKGEYKDKFGHLNNVSVFGTNSYKTELLRINPFSFPKDIHVLEHIDRLVEIFNVCWPMYAAMPAVLKDSIERAYVNAGWDLMKSVCKYEKKYGQVIYPSFADVLLMINIVMNESQYSADSKGDYVGALSTRLKSLTNGIYGQIFTSNELSNETLYDSNVIIDLSRVGSTETKSLIMGLLVMKMQEYRMSSRDGNNSGLKHITVLEEAHNLLKKTSSEQSADSSNLLGKSVEMLANSIAEMRTYGEGFIIADQSPGLLDMSVIRNTNTKIILRVPDFSDRELVGKAASLNDDQIIELAKLETGVAAVYQNNWLEPVLCKVDKCRDDEKRYVYEPTVDYNYDEDQIKREIIDYLMLPAPKKLEVDLNIVSKLEKHVYRLQLSADLKTHLLRYFNEKNPSIIQNMRSHIVFDMFNSKMALLLSNTEKNDINSWYNVMLEKLEPSIENFKTEEQEKILAIITHENAEREQNEEAFDLRNGFLGYIKKGGK